MDISYSAFRQNLKKTIDTVSNTHEPLFIVSHKIRKAVLISYEDYESLAETAYLMQSPAMAKRLIQAIGDIKESKSLVQHDIINET